MSSWGGSERRDGSRSQALPGNALHRGSCLVRSSARQEPRTSGFPGGAWEPVIAWHADWQMSKAVRTERAKWRASNQLRFPTPAASSPDGQAAAISRPARYARSLLRRGGRRRQERRFIDGGPGICRGARLCGAHPPQRHGADGAGRRLDSAVARMVPRIGRPLESDGSAPESQPRLLILSQRRRSSRSCISWFRPERITNDFPVHL